MVDLTAVMLDATGVLGGVSLCDICYLHVIEDLNVVISEQQE